MTKKDYILIAGVIRTIKNESNNEQITFDDLINEFGYQLQRENPRFDISKFKKAINN